ncbi:MAG: HAD family hydrolase [Anaerovoracaceae bacterium]
MKKLCIFDLDGTLLDSIMAIAITSNLTLKDYGIAPIESKVYKKLVGEGVGKLVENFLEYRCAGSRVPYEEALQRYHRYFEVHCMDEIKPYPGILSLLERLKAQGMKLAVLSNKTHARTVENVEGVFGKGYFDSIQGETDLWPRKPDPTGAQKSAERLGFSPEECIYIGDTAVDMQTGLSAGMTTVGVLWGFREKAELAACNPHHLIAEPEELLALI